MFGRPRCREWTPLATQQLRLRCLIQIVGYNIRPPEHCTSQCSFYMTLHHTTMSAPFYMSERISSPHPKWKEIDSEITQRMSSTNIVVRIWCHVPSHNSSKESSRDSSDTDKSQDTLIQTWGVYFSGLRYIGANLALNFTSECFKTNTLVFQMHGGYFCSYKSLKLDIIPPENEYEHRSMSSGSSATTSSSKHIIATKYLTNRKVVKESRSISPSSYSRKNEVEISKSHSPVERGFKQNFPSIRTSTSLTIDSKRNKKVETFEPSQIYEHSPETLEFKNNCDKTSPKSDNNIDISETAENYDLRNESDWVPKYRYLAINFLKSEIRPSYNVTKLQKLHLLQYSIKKKQEAVDEIKRRIYKISDLSETDESLMDQYDIKPKFKSRSQRNLFSTEFEESLCKNKSSSEVDLSKNGRVADKPVSNGPRLTLKLNDLLSLKTKPSPFQRSEHVRLTKQLEILRFKRILLTDERDSKLANIRRLKETYNKLFEENQDIGTELMQNYYSLSRRNETLKETRESSCALRELAARTHVSLMSRRVELLHELSNIFHVDQLSPTSWSIINVPFPICGDDHVRMTTPLSDSVAAGLVAQTVVLTAALLGQHLRYKISLLGSASKILDVTPNLPDPNIPLFARGGDVTLFRYAVFLLNKCIAQLLCARGQHVTDLRPTLANLKALMMAPYNISDTSKLFNTYKWTSEGECPRTQSLRSLVATERGKLGRQFNRFKDAVDGQSPQTLMSLRHRHSRSVGSYRDDQDIPSLSSANTSIMGSEPNIYHQSNPSTSLQDRRSTFKTHNSDSEITNMAAENNMADKMADKVIFTVGEDSIDVDKGILVKLSVNNGDESYENAKENVKQICTEINDFCSKTDEGFDVANHMDIAKYMEERKASVEQSCECDDLGIEGSHECASVVKEVIVIPSAEAKIDTGQGDVLNEIDCNINEQ